MGSFLYRCACFFLFLMSIAFLSGCWDRQEIDDLGIVLGTGLDKGENGELRLIVQIAIPTEMGGGQHLGGRGGDLTHTIVGTGTTVYEALTDVQRKFSKRIFFGHNRVLIIDEKLAHDGIAEYIDFFIQHPEPRLRAMVMVSKNTEEALRTETSVNTNSAQVLEGILHLIKTGLPVTVKDVFQMLRQNGDGIILPWMSVSNDEEEETVQVMGAAIFDHDKMIETIDFELTKGILWLRGDMELSTITVNPAETDGRISFYLINAQTTLISSIEGDNWKITAEIESEVEMVENQTTLDASSEEVQKKLEHELDEKIESEIRATLEKVQKEMKTDVFGFADAFQRKYPKEFADVKSDWKEIFPEIEVEVSSSAKIRRIGMTTSHVGVSENEVKEE